MDKFKHVVDDRIPDTDAEATDAKRHHLQPQIQISKARDSPIATRGHGGGGGTTTMAKRTTIPTTSGSVETRAALTVLKLCGRGDGVDGDATAAGATTIRRRAARNLRDKLRGGLLTESSFAALPLLPPRRRPTKTSSPSMGRPPPADAAECVVRGLVLEVGTLRRLLEGTADDDRHHGDGCDGDERRWRGGVGSNLELLGRHRRRRQRIEESENEVLVLLELLRCAIRGAGCAGGGGGAVIIDTAGENGNADIARVLAYLRSTMLSSADVDGSGGTGGPSSDTTTMNHTIIPLVDGILSSLGRQPPSMSPSSTTLPLPERFFGEATGNAADEAGTTPVDAATEGAIGSQENGQGRVVSSSSGGAGFLATEKGPLGSSVPTGEVAPSFAHASGADADAFHRLGAAMGGRTVTSSDARGAEPRTTSATRVQQQNGPPNQNGYPRDSAGFGVELARGALNPPTSSSSAAPQFSYKSSHYGPTNVATASGTFSPPSRDFHYSTSVPVPNGSFHGNSNVPPTARSDLPGHGHYPFSSKNDPVAAPSSAAAASPAGADSSSIHGLPPIFTLGYNFANDDAGATNLVALTESQRDVLIRLESLLDSYRHRRSAAMRGVGGVPREQPQRESLFTTASGAAANRLYLDTRRCKGVDVTNVEHEGEIVALLARLTDYELADIPLGALLGNANDIGGDGGAGGGSGSGSEGERFLIALLDMLCLLAPSGGASPPTRRHNDGVLDGTGAADGVADGRASNLTAADPSASSSRLSHCNESASNQMAAPWQQQQPPRERRPSRRDSHGLVLCILRFLEALLNRLLSHASHLSLQARTDLGRLRPPVRRDVVASSLGIDGVCEKNTAQLRAPTHASATTTDDIVGATNCTSDSSLGTSSMLPKRSARGFSLGGVALAVHRATSAHVDSSDCSIKAIASSICVMSFPVLSDSGGAEACMVGELRREAPNGSLQREQMSVLSAARVSSVLSSLVHSAIITMRSFSGEAHSTPQSAPSSLLLGVRYLCALPRDAATAMIEVPASDASTQFDECYHWSERNVSASASISSPSVTVPSLLAECVSALNASQSSPYAGIADSNVLASSCLVAVAQPSFDPCDISCDPIAGAERMLREMDGHSAGSSSSSSTRAMTAVVQRAEAHFILFLPILAKKRVLGKYAESAWHGELRRVIGTPPTTEEDHELLTASMSLLSRLLPFLADSALLRSVANTCAISVLCSERRYHCGDDGQSMDCSQSSRQSICAKGQLVLWEAHHAMLMFLRRLFQCCCNGNSDDIPEQPMQNENSVCSQIDSDGQCIRLTEVLVRGFVLPEKHARDQDITERVPTRCRLAAISVLSHLFGPRGFQFCSRPKNGDVRVSSEGTCCRKLEERPFYDLIQSLITVVARRQHTLDRDSVAFASLSLLRTGAAEPRTKQFLSKDCWSHDEVGVSWLFRLINVTGVPTVRAMAYGIISDLLLSGWGTSLLTWPTKQSENGLTSPTGRSNAGLFELASRVACYNQEPPLVRAECFGLLANVIKIGGYVSNGDLVDDIIPSIKQIVMNTTKVTMKGEHQQQPGAREPLEQKEASVEISPTCYLAAVRLLRVIILSLGTDNVCVNSKLTPPSVNGMVVPCVAAPENTMDSRDVNKGHCFQVLSTADFLVGLAGTIDMACPYADRGFVHFNTDVLTDCDIQRNCSPRYWQLLALAHSTNAAIFDVFSAVLARNDQDICITENRSPLLLHTLHVLTKTTMPTKLHAPLFADAQLDCFSSACQCLARIFLRYPKSQGDAIQPLEKVFNQESRRALGVSLRHVLAHCTSIGGKFEALESIYDLLTSALCNLSPSSCSDIFLPTNGTNGDTECSLLQTIVDAHMLKVTATGTLELSNEDKLGHNRAPKSLGPAQIEDAELFGQELRAKSAFVLGRLWEATIDSTSGLLDDVAGALASVLLSELRDAIVMLENAMPNKDCDGHNIMANVMNFPCPATAPRRRHGRNCETLCINICLALTVLRPLVRRSSAKFVACRNDALSTIIGKIFPVATTADKKYKGEAMIELILGTICNFAAGNSKAKQSLCSGKKSVLHMVSELALRRTSRSGCKTAALTPLVIDLSFKVLRVLSLPNSPARGILASCYTKVVKTLISILPLARKYSAENNEPSKSLWHSRAFGAMALLVNATLDEEWRKTVLIDWTQFAAFLTISVEMKDDLGCDLQKMTLLLLRNLCLGPPRKSAVLLNHPWIHFIIASCRSENESTRHAATTALWCLCYKSEKAVAVIKSKCNLQQLLHAPYA